MPSKEDFDESDEPPEPDEVTDDDDMVLDDSSDEEEFVEFDPSGRYGRYAEVLGKGAMKTVYRAYDMVDCKEVAWNKVRPPMECSDEQAVAVQREIHLLQRLNHKGIIKIYSAWGDDVPGDTDFITELCSSTLLEYRLKHKHVSRKAVRSWGRQILQGLAHLHMQDPPIIHRDLKCENILVKCRSNTSLKIGDFGSATFLDETHHMHTLVGTPEFMAPEMFQEDYNELVDVYSFGMCMLELLTRECPYSECKSLGQIYKKVINGEKPRALYKVTDVQALSLINRCLLPACKRPSASELLADPFLQCQGASANSGQSMKNSNSMPNLRNPNCSFGVKNMLSGQGVGKLSRPCVTTRRNAGDMAQADLDPLLKPSADHGRQKALFIKSPSFRRSYQVMGRVEDQNTLCLKIRIQESSRFCDIDFPFDLRYDSPRSVAEEMVRALEYSESDLHTIADLISKEIEALAPRIQEKSEMRAAPMELRGSFPESCRSASWLDAGISFGQSLSGKFDCTANQIAQPTNNDEKTANSILGIECTNMVSLSDDKCSEVMESRAEERQFDDAMFFESNPMPVRDKSSRDSFSCERSSEQAANERASKLSYDKLSASSGANWGTFNTSHAIAGAVFSSSIPNGSITRVSGECGDFGNNPVLESSNGRMLPSRGVHKSSSSFKQLPAGIGILLWPSSEQGLRRALPSCINAFA